MEAEIFEKSNRILKTLLGNDATFREGQYEAIEATMTKKRTLVVQRTGWGKSLIYFACTRLLREQGKGVTLVISPLLVLMKNQLEAANRLGLNCDVLNGTTRERHSEILEKMKNDELDLVLVTPETLFKEEIRSQLNDIRIGLFVIDEAHCISDWGHDFRLKYGELHKVMKNMFADVPVLATTATANDRVIADLETQLGGDVFISRGPLTRESLSIQVLNMPSRVERYAWILENVPKLDGSGIIYCLTRRDCDYLADFLQKNGISAMPYYSDEKNEARNKEAEEKFEKNEIKVIVATIKLGMGYDKGDISFVIHYQMPSNIVSYYQQIGRAGRNIERAYAFLMYGKEDVDIVNHFINTAFPNEDETMKIMDTIFDSNGIGKFGIEAQLNMRRSRIEKALDFLENDGYITRSRGKYYLSPKPFKYDREKYDEILKIRKFEVDQMLGLLTQSGCYSKYIVNALDDFSAKPCGCCEKCLGKPILPQETSLASKERAASYIDKLIMSIEPRKKWALTDYTSATKIEFINKDGICLSRYGEAGYGELVKRDKYSGEERFCDELVGKSAELLLPIIKENNIKHITCVPSLRSQIVKDFANRLAESCKITFVELLGKIPAFPQKKMENNAYQCANAYASFFVKEDAKDIPEKIILVDDIVDSRWTLTVCGYKLGEVGVSEVYPFALANSSSEVSNE